VNLNDPVIRFLAWIVAIAVAIRVIFELIAPVLPYLVVGLIVFTVVRVVNWYRGRW
jgi:hypothetical protein